METTANCDGKNIFEVLQDMGNAVEDARDSLLVGVTPKEAVAALVNLIQQGLMPLIK